MKSVRIRSFLWSIFSCNWTKNRKIRTRKNSVFGHFSCSDIGKNTSRYVDTLTTLAHSLSNCSGTQSHNNLVRKRTFNHLAKLTVNNWAVFLVLIYLGKIWLYVLITSHACFKVNRLSIVVSISRNSLLETGAISDV